MNNSIEIIAGVLFFTTVFGCTRTQLDEPHRTKRHATPTQKQDLARLIHRYSYLYLMDHASAGSGLRRLHAAHNAASEVDALDETCE